MDYGFLIGREFTVAGRSLRAVALSGEGADALIEAAPADAPVDSVALAGTFPAHEVLTTLAVDEEIELASPLFG